MEDEDIITPHDKLNASFFHALRHDNDDKVIELCNCEARDREGPLYNMALHGSTVLHMACFLGKFNLAKKLLEIVYRDLSSEDDIYDKLSTPQNAWGNTILHDATTSNSYQGIEFVDKLLERLPRLLEVRNKWGESPLLHSIRFGMSRMSKFLLARVDKFCHTDWHKHLKLLKREDNMTVLHMAILTRQFDVALIIAERYPQLYHEQDSSHNMTALHMLARSPTAFKSGTKLGTLQKLVYSIVSTDEQYTTTEVGMIRKATNFISGSNCCIYPMTKDVRRLKKGNKDALKLAKKLIETDASWKKTYMPLNYSESSTPHLHNSARQKKSPPTQSKLKEKELDDKVGEEGCSEKSVEKVAKEPPKETTGKGVGNDQVPLFLATKKGCIEIVEEILGKYPQAVDYLNHNQENLFHVAIKSRNLDIIHMVKKKNLIRRGQLEAVDKHFNTIMHKVGYKSSIFGKANKNAKKNPTNLTTAEEVVLMDTKIKTPIQHLSDELRLLESLEELCPDYMKNHRNKDNLTARELFAKTNARLREKAMEYLKQTAEHCTVVTILIATVAFAAAYTVPGGPDERTGLPVLLGQPLFLVFTITDVLSLGFGLTAVVIFLTILTSQFRMKDFQRTLPQRLLLGLTLLFLSVSMMMVSFAATIILTINTKQNWTKIALYIVSFFPVVIFMLSYIPFYKELLETLNYCITRIGRSLPKPRFVENHKDASSSGIV